MRRIKMVQITYNQRKVNQQVNRRPGPRAHPAHLAALAAEKQRARVRVRVEPTKEEYRQLSHPNGMKFRKEGSVEWPFDRFTQRRLADGSIKIVAQIDSQTGQVVKPATQARGSRPAEAKAEK
jgi:hypothetical protein